jgi:hypothetical protein
MELKAEADPRLENLQKAREAKRIKRKQKKEAPPPHEGNGTLMEPDFELDRFYEMINALTNEFLTKNFVEQQIRDLCLTMRETLERCSKRLQILEAQRTAMLCDHCHKVLPGGRFAGEIVITDELTNQLKALRACSEGCYREISRMANERRQRHQGSIRGTVAM